MKLPIFKSAPSFGAAIKGGLTLLLAAGLVSSCEDKGTDGPTPPPDPEDVPSVVSITNNGLKTSEIAFDATEFSYTINLAKSAGTPAAATTVTFEYDETLIEDGQTALPAEAAEFAATVDMEANATTGTLVLTFDIDELLATITPGEALEYVYPVKIASVTGDNVKLDDTKNYILIGITVTPEVVNPPDPTELTVVLQNKGELVTVSGGIGYLYRPAIGNLGERTVTVTATIAEALEDDLTITYEVDPKNYVNVYNLNSDIKYQTFSTTAPEFTAGGPLVIAAGATTGSIDITIDPSMFPYTKIDGGLYMLPVKLTGTDNPDVAINDAAKAVVHFILEMAGVDTGTYTMTIGDDENIGNTRPGGAIGASASVRLYTKKGALEDLAPSLPAGSTGNTGIPTYFNNSVGNTAIMPVSYFIPGGPSLPHEVGSTAFWRITDQVDGGKYKIMIDYPNTVWAANGIIPSPGSGSELLLNESTFDPATGNIVFIFNQQTIFSWAPGDPAYQVGNVRRTTTPDAL